jgi:uncharacterized protein YfaP (DUF2135 family)
MDDENPVGHEVSRREAMKTALKVGVYAAPIVLSASIPATASAQVSGAAATVTGTISSAATGLPIAGATVTVSGDYVGTTNSSGIYIIFAVPPGTREIIVRASGFSSRSDSVGIASTGTTNFSTALVLASASGNITIVLTWGATPSDLDSHLTGPIPGGSSRFHAYFDNEAPVPYAALEIDDTNGFGPETIRVSPVSGLFVPGEYRYFVNNYSGTPGFNATPATVAVFQGGVQIGQFQASAASGAPTAAYWWVFNFTLTATATGAIAITSIQTFASTGESDARPELWRRK